MEYEYREPKEGDENRLSELCGELGYPSSTKAVVGRLRDLAGRDDHFLLVAADADDQPVGWVHAFIHHLMAADSFAQVGGMVVKESCRGCNIGTTLLARAEQWARKKGSKEIRLRSNIVREQTHGFYISRGYAIVKTSHLFQKKL